MRKAVFKYIFILAAFFYLPLNSMAWGLLGHRIVGEIADSYLNAKARAEIRKILGNETIAMASNWADLIKSDTAYRYLSTWHYVDFDKGLTYPQMQQFLAKDSSADAWTKLHFLIAELKKKNLAQDKKQMYLRLLIHIVGDLHQPLHVSAHGTSGGNDIKVMWFNDNTNLHTVWDSQLIDFQNLSYTEYTKAINFTTAAQRKTWQQQPLSLWLFESYSISGQLHDEIKDPNPRLSYTYNYTHVNILNQQLLKGGVHLAGLLNQIFG
jgi:hypothetical protein